ncbi:putative RNA polymerase II subunit B1 CTD phosphatase RPAP2 homolog [Oryza glaberrima]|uniref:RNA polymerase II subunit B1 CTD phosphatase RPAP2 homolog n=2 Tax=Oryza TaxID=4527 RepID=A0A0D3G2X6_9ORYZ|nr:putative RNA polymerase II subunit B1 CTD phosphatase RPAP2 homolog [Oryza glaberrima]
MGPTTATDAGARMKPTTVASAVHRVQMALYDGAAASREPLLRAAASLLSGPDYADVVTERSIADACGYPACPNPLPSEDARGKAAPRFRISLREHRVYDLEEARKFCSERCLVASAAFGASLPPDRPFGVSPDRLDALVALFEGGGGGGGDGGLALGFGASGDGKEVEEGRKVEIMEKEAAGTGEVTLQEWIGPSDAIEGYVPRRDRVVGGPKKEAKQNDACSAEQSSNINVDSRNASSGESGMVLTENTKAKKKEATKTPLKMFKQDEDNDMLSSCISDSIAKQLEDVVLEEKKDKKKNKAAKGTSRVGKSKPAKRPVGRDGHEVDFTSTIIMGDHGSEMMDHGALGQYNFSSSILANEQPSSSQYAAIGSVQAYTEELDELFSNAVNIAKDETSDDSGRCTLRSSLKAVGSKNARRSVKWADENGSVLETSRAFVSHSSKSQESMDSSVRRESAEACAAALIEAAEAISSGTSEVEDAVSKAGIIILPDMVNQQQYNNDYDNDKDAGENEIFEIDRGVVKWPKKTVLLDTDMFDVDDSWHDTPPEGFSLTLSSFATMWAALFGWVSRSSLAYVYGLDESSMEDLLIAGGRECPQKRVLNDGHSSEIRRALDTCVCNALPVLVSNLRMQIPVSKLEITLGYLLDTMSFVDALPSLRSRQWQLMVLVLLDALSLHRLPALAPIMSDSKLLQKLLNSAQVSREEYDSMIDLLLPFGRSTQSQASLPS